MSLPKRLEKLHTHYAIKSLAKKFNLPNTTSMQDWQYEAADPKRIGEFLEAYEKESFTDDEKFTLMEIILESFREIDNFLKHPEWPKCLLYLKNNAELHFTTLCYWSMLDISEAEAKENPDYWFPQTKYIRKILLSTASTILTSEELKQLSII